MKSRFYLFFLLLFSISSCQQLTDQKVFYLAHSLTREHPVHQGMEVFAEEVEKNSNGKLRVKIFPDGQLGTDREVLELLQIGSIAIAKVNAAVMSNFAPEYKVLGVPYLFRNKEHIFKVLEGEIGENMLNAGSEYLLKGLCFYDGGSRSFYTVKKQIKTPEDLKGMKIRVMNHQMSMDMVNAMGGSATPMAFGELYTALQQGVVDGAENNPPSFISSRHYDVCKYFTLDEHSSIPDVMVIGTKFWDKLSDEEKGWIKTATKTSVEAQKRFWKENVEECFRILKKDGVEIFKPEKSLFADKTKKVLKEFVKDPEMKRIIDAIQAIE